MPDKISFFLSTKTTASTTPSVRAGTRLEGTLPRDISLLTDMVTFNVGQMSLTGPIEGLFTRWSKVELIALFKNQFTGSLPVNLDKETPNLKTLTLFENKLSGEIPASLGNLPVLEDLRLDRNTLSGPLQPALGGLGKLSKCNEGNPKITPLLHLCYFVSYSPNISAILFT